MSSPSQQMNFRSREREAATEIGADAPCSVNRNLHFRSKHTLTGYAIDWCGTLISGDTIVETEEMELGGLAWSKPAPRARDERPRALWWRPRCPGLRYGQQALELVGESVLSGGSHHLIDDFTVLEEQ